MRINPENGSGGEPAEPGAGEPAGGNGIAYLTLENIIDMTGELEHLNELVMLHLCRDGGFSGQASYYAIVTPILDRLEVSIRQEFREGMDRDAIKGIIRCWIDREISLVR